jgi:hypothetical protein
LGISSRPPGEFSLTSAGTKNPGQVNSLPFTITISRPKFSGLTGRRFAERRVANQIVRQLGIPFQKALDIYWRMLEEWSDSIAGRLRQSFEIYAEDYRARAEQALSGTSPNTAELAAIQTRLSQLEADEVPEKDRTNSARTHASYLPETSSKLPEVFQRED